MKPMTAPPTPFGRVDANRTLNDLIDWHLLRQGRPTTGEDNTHQSEALGQMIAEWACWSPLDLFDVAIAMFEDANDISTTRLLQLQRRDLLRARQIPPVEGY